jgi:hypoxanthine phosphoribosyltransferase
MSGIKVVFDEDTIRRRIKEVGAQIRQDAGEREVLLIGILKGSSVFLADLLRAIPGKVHYEWVNVILAVSDTGTAEATEIDFLTQFPIHGYRVYVLKDIVTSGVIETYLLTQLRERSPETLKLVSLIDCPDARTVALECDFSVFTLARGRFVGYGLESDRVLGNLPYIGLID